MNSLLEREGRGRVHRSVVSDAACPPDSCMILPSAGRGRVS